MKPNYSARKYGLPIMAIEDRLKMNVIVDTVSNCWEWQRKTNGHGYGQIQMGSRKDGTRKTCAAHRVSYMVFRGEIPEGMFVCHKCDNPLCINPEHLFLGTRQDNTDDRERKGRNIVKNGEGHSLSKLSMKDVQNARWERSQKKTPYARLAKKYGVSKQTIMNAIKGKTWKCVQYFPKPEKEDESNDA